MPKTPHSSLNLSSIVHFVVRALRALTYLPRRAGTLRRPSLGCSRSSCSRPCHAAPVPCGDLHWAVRARRAHVLATPRRYLAATFTGLFALVVLTYLPRRAGTLRRPSLGCSRSSCSRTCHAAP